MSSGPSLEYKRFSVQENATAGVEVVAAFDRTGKIMYSTPGDFGGYAEHGTEAVLEFKSGRNRLDGRSDFNSNYDFNSLLNQNRKDPKFIPKELLRKGDDYFKFGPKDLKDNGSISAGFTFLWTHTGRVENLSQGVALEENRSFLISGAKRGLSVGSVNGVTTDIEIEPNSDEMSLFPKDAGLIMSELVDEGNYNIEHRYQGVGASVVYSSEFKPLVSIERAGNVSVQYDAQKTHRLSNLVKTGYLLGDYAELLSKEWHRHSLSPVSPVLRMGKYFYDLAIHEYAREKEEGE